MKGLAQYPRTTDLKGFCLCFLFVYVIPFTAVLSTCKFGTVHTHSSRLPPVVFRLYPVCSLQFCAYLEVIDVRVDTEESYNLESILDCMSFLHFTIPACVCSVEFCLGNMLHVHICTSRLRILNFQVESQRHQNYS